MPNLTDEQTCRIFNGTYSNFWKVAFFGIQNCCDTPTGVNLFDYILLTKTVGNTLPTPPARCSKLQSSAASTLPLRSWDSRASITQMVWVQLLKVPTTRSPSRCSRQRGKT